MKKEHKEKIKNFNPEVQELYNRLTNFDLEEKYPVYGLETEITGIDILTIQDMYVTEMKKKGAWYKTDNCIVLNRCSCK